MDLATYYNRFCKDWEHVKVTLKEATANVYRINMELVADKYFVDYLLCFFLYNKKIF